MWTGFGPAALASLLGEVPLPVVSWGLDLLAGALVAVGLGLAVWVTDHPKEGRLAVLHRLGAGYGPIIVLCVASSALFSVLGDVAGAISGDIILRLAALALVSVFWLGWLYASVEYIHAVMSQEPRSILRLMLVPFAQAWRAVAVSWSAVWRGFLLIAALALLQTYQRVFVPDPALAPWVYLIAGSIGIGWWLRGYLRAWQRWRKPGQGEPSHRALRGLARRPLLIWAGAFVVLVGAFDLLQPGLPIVASGVAAWQAWQMERGMLNAHAWSVAATAGREASADASGALALILAEEGNQGAGGTATAAIALNPLASAGYTAQGLVALEQGNPSQATIDALALQKVGVVGMGDLLLSRASLELRVKTPDEWSSLDRAAGMYGVEALLTDPGLSLTMPPSRPVTPVFGWESRLTLLRHVLRSAATGWADAILAPARGGKELDLALAEVKVQSMAAYFTGLSTFEPLNGQVERWVAGVAADLGDFNGVAAAGGNFIDPAHLTNTTARIGLDLATEVLARHSSVSSVTWESLPWTEPALSMAGRLGAPDQLVEAAAAYDVVMRNFTAASQLLTPALTGRDVALETSRSLAGRMWGLYALSEYEEGSADMALTAAQQAIRFGDVAEGATVAAGVEDENGNLRAAVKDYHQALRAAPQSFMTWYNLGEVELTLNDPVAALSAFQQATYYHHVDRLAGVRVFGAPMEGGSIGTINAGGDRGDQAIQSGMQQAVAELSGNGQ